MVTDNENQKKIEESKFRALNAALLMVEEIVGLGATPNEVDGAIKGLEKRTREMAVIVLARADDKAVELRDLLSPTLSERMGKDAAGEDGRPAGS